MRIDPLNKSKSSLSASLFEQAVQAKEAYRKDARVLTWEEKVASIECMRDAFIEARKSMAQVRRQNQSCHPATSHSP